MKECFKYICVCKSYFFLFFNGFHQQSLPIKQNFFFFLTFRPFQPSANLRYYCIYFKFCLISRDRILAGCPRSDSNPGPLDQRDVMNRNMYPRNRSTFLSQVKSKISLEVVLKGLKRVRQGKKVGVPVIQINELGNMFVRFELNVTSVS